MPRPPNDAPWYDAEAIAAAADAMVPRLLDVRHDLHRHPELGFEEHRTQGIVRDWLSEQGYATRISAETGLIADLRPNLVGRERTIALRADLDCLPMHESTDLPYRSVHPGRAHKCGHDGHTAILMGTARILAAYRDRIPGNVRLVFQPAEEGVRGGGARVMVAEGTLDAVDEVYALHNWPQFPRGQVRVRAGVMMARTHTVSITVTGVGGHGSQPQLVRDPIVAASHLVVALQTIVSRGLGYEGGAVVSIGKLEAGTTDNVIPAQACLLGTIRTFSDAVAERVLERLREIVDGIATTFGVTTALEIEDGYPVVHNDPRCTEAVARVARGLFGEGAVSDEGLPMAGAEDFAYMARAKPAAYFFLGSGDGVVEPPGCHHPDFDFDDRLIPMGIRMFVGLVADRLAETASVGP
jgi:amidohydrolase